MIFKHSTYLRKDVTDYTSIPKEGNKTITPFYIIN